MQNSTKDKLDPLNPLSHFREATWEEATEEQKKETDRKSVV